jgi:release factor glutamine methyltransferase
MNMQQSKSDKMDNSVSALLRASGLPDLEARILLGHVLGVDRAWLIAHAGETIAGESVGAFRVLCTRRLGGEPVAYLVGKREFYGLPIGVTPAVLIPRPETELLVELALERMPKDTIKNVLDLGTGSGCVALAIANERPRATVTATDNSPAALEVARANAGALGLVITLFESDWYTTLGERRFDLIVSNPPYIASGDPHLREGDLRFEPAAALTDGADGFAAINNIVKDAPKHLVAGGWLLFEHGYDQAEVARVRLQAAGFAEVQSWRDLAGIERVSGGMAR